MKSGHFVFYFVSFLLFLFSQTLARTAFALGHNYYINAKGNDDNDGSRQHPWRTINKLNKIKMQPGDDIYIQENVSFDGILYLKDIHGEKGSPIIIQSNQNKPAIINAKDSSAIVLDDCSYVSINNITAIGSGRKRGNIKDGIAINNSHHISIENVAASGFQKAGLSIHNSNHILAKNVSAHDNGFAGISIFGEYGNKLHCKNIRIIHSNAYNNPGDPTNFGNHSGNGIIAGFCTQVLIDSCTAFNNGWDMPRKGNGPVGIWCFEADSVVIQHCISYQNKTSKGGEDGGGYDFDGGTTHSIIQYCLSYRNEGSAFGIFQYDGASPWHDNVIRFCISENDGNTSAARANAYVWNSSHDSSQFKNFLFYNNILYNKTNAALAYSTESEHSNFCFYNNIFVANNALLRGDYGKDIFIANDWWSLQHRFHIDSSFIFSAWAHQHNKEQLNGKVKGLNVQPLFVKAGNTWVTDVFNLSLFSNYHLKSSSPVNGSGIDLQRLYGIDVGKVDFNGLRIKSNFIGAARDKTSIFYFIKINPAKPFSYLIFTTLTSSFFFKSITMKKAPLFITLLLLLSTCITAQKTQKPPLHGRHWMAVTGKPLAAEAGAKIFERGGNAVDAACGMLAAVCTMWDVLSWGGETQVLIYNPTTKKVIAINALGVAPTGATVQFFKSKGYSFPPEYGPLSAVTPGTPGGLCLMLANWGTMSLKDVLEPAMEMAAGYPIEAETANSFERNKKMLKEWQYSKAVFLPHLGEQREAPEAGELFMQKDLLSTLTKMVEAEQGALHKGKSRKEAIMAAYNRFYKGDIAEEFVRGCKEQGGLITMEDLAKWKPVEEEPLQVNYKGVEVYKLHEWTQGPAMLQCLNILENFDLKTMGYNSPQYINTVYQSMSLAFADRDFYYGDPYFTQPPIKGLLNKEYAKERAKLINPNYNDSTIAPGDPYKYEGKQNPYLSLLQKRKDITDTNKNKKGERFLPKHDQKTSLNKVEDNGLYAINTSSDSLYKDRLWRGTTSIEAADSSGWVVSVTPSGGWTPACIAGHTGVGMSQRMQSFVLDSIVDPFNVVAPGKRPRVTLTPSLAMKDGKPYAAFAVQGGDTQDQNLLQFFLNLVEFNMTVQEATEAPNINTEQLWLSLGGMQISDRAPHPGSILVDINTPDSTRTALQKMGYHLSFGRRTSGPINAIYFDTKHGTLWGGSSNNGEDYGIGW